MVEDGQVRRLWKLLSRGSSLGRAAVKCGMDEKTARKYRRTGKQPSEEIPDHDWRTRTDPFVDVWPEIYEQLEVNPGLQGKTLFEWLQRQYAGRFQDGQLRSFQRGVKRWRATQGPPKEVYFGQVHKPGRLCASDFTHMTSLAVTIQSQLFVHMVYHFVLTYSNWESVTICFSESFESLSEGVQNALWELGGVPERHRTDRMSTAVNNLSEEKEFTERYQGLMNHYGIQMEKIQAGKANENGDVESSHRHFKEAVDQALMLRGSCDFLSREAYGKFLRDLVTQKNAGRRQRLDEEVAVLRALPNARRESCKRVPVRVDSGCLIRADENTYSVSSRLIGERVQVRLYAEHLEVWYGQRQVESFPRLRGRGKHRINYRHVIDSLVRKPGAFENYRYRDELFPTSRFRMAYDALCESVPGTAVREYLRILELAARVNESSVDDALRVLLNGEQPLTFDQVRTFVEGAQQAPAITEVVVEKIDLTSFDCLLTEEYRHGSQHGCEIDIDGTVAGITVACVS